MYIYKAENILSQCTKNIIIDDVPTEKWMIKRLLIELFINPLN